MSRNSALTARARRYLADAVHAFDHAPVEVTLSVILAVTFSWMVSSEADPAREWAELAIVIVLAGSAAFIATLLHALGAWGSRTRWIVTIAGAAAAALYGMFVLDLQLVSEAWRAAALLAAAVLLILSAPAFGGKVSAAAPSAREDGTSSGPEGNASAFSAPSMASAENPTGRFRRVSGRLVVRTLAVLLYAGALYAGLALALGAVNTLFELRLDGRIYAHTFGWVFFVLVPWVIVGGLQDYVRPAEGPGAVAAVIHRMSAFLVTPLLAIYYIILYAYAVRIALTGDLPKNLVSPLVIAAGLIAGIALVLFDRADGERRSWLSLRIAAPLFVPLSLLGLWALTMRLEQYGWTEFRGLRTVLLCTLGVLALMATIAVLRRRDLRLYLFPLVLAVTTIAAVVGPWSTIAGSRRSQQARLAEALDAAGIDGNALTIRDSLVANEPFREINETATYLTQHFGARSLPPLFAQHADRSGNFRDVVHATGLRPTSPDVAAPRGGYAYLSQGAVFPDGAGGTLHYVRIERDVALERHSAQSGTERPGAAGDSAVAVADTVVEPLILPVTVGDLRLTADLTAVARALPHAMGQNGLDADVARVLLRDGTGRERGELIVLEIGIGGERPMRVHRLIGVARLY